MTNTETNLNETNTKPAIPFSIKIIAGLMILFGLAEVVTGFTHYFFGLTTSKVTISTYIGVMLGGCYFVGGLLLLTKKKWAAFIAVVLLCIDVTGRLGMVITDLYPVNTFFQITGITIGTLIAAFFAVYVGLKLKYFK
jgi:hypothetical protein